MWHHLPQVSCKIKDFNSCSWDWITQNYSQKASETFTTAWILFPAIVKLSLMRKILLINNLYELLYSSKSISFLIYSLKHWHRFLQFCVFFLIVLLIKGRSAFISKWSHFMATNNMLSSEKRLLTGQRS